MLLRQDFGFEGTLLCRIHVKQKDKLYFIKIFILKRQNVEEKLFCLGVLAWEIGVRERLWDLCLSYLILERVGQVQEIASNLFLKIVVETSHL